MKEIMKTLESEDQFYEMIKEDQTVVFVFSAQWCPDCIFIKPFLPELIEKYRQFRFVYVNRDEYIDLCLDQEVLGIPSFIAFRKGKEIGRFVSRLRKTKDEIDEFLEEMMDK